MLRIIYFLFILCFQLVAQASAQGYQIDRYFYQDAQNKISIDSVDNVHFQAYSGTLRLGFQSSPTWIRLKIHPSEGQIKTASITNLLILRVSPHYLDHIDVYQFVGGVWSYETAGDLHKKTAQLCADDTHCFTLRLSEHPDDAIYLRVQTEGLTQIQTEVQLADELMDVVLSRIKSITTGSTIATLLCILALVFVLFARTMLTHTYLLCQAVIALHIFFSTGGQSEPSSTWAPETLNLLLHVLFVFRVCAMGLVGWGFLYNYEMSKSYKNCMIIFALICVLSLCLILIGHVQLGLEIALAVFIINPIVQVLGIYKVKKMPQKIRLVLYVTYGVYVVSGYCISLVALGFFSQLATADLVQHVSDVRLNGLLIAALTFWAVITEQSQQKLEKMQEIQALELNAAQAQANQNLVNERNALIDMLTHELKTPLSTIRFALATLKSKFNTDDESMGRVQRIDSSVIRMNTMIEHVARSNKIDRTVLDASTTKIPAAELMEELINEFSHAERFDLHIQDDTYFKADRQMLTLILENLLSNAYKYTADQKISIWIDQQVQAQSGRSDLSGHASATSTVTRFVISNRVAADSEPDEARLFERYYRHPNFQNHAGMGIGLSLVHSAAEKIGAHVSYKHENACVIFEVNISNEGW
jgi:signal transduction histidine kinase